MSTARQVVPLYPVTTDLTTGPAGRATVQRNPVLTSPLWAYGVAPGGLLSTGNTTAPSFSSSPPAPAGSGGSGGSSSSPGCGCS